MGSAWSAVALRPCWEYGSCRSSDTIVMSRDICKAEPVLAPIIEPAVRRANGKDLAALKVLLESRPN
jgi:hypothetical protein